MLPILLYCLEVCELNKSNVASLDFCVSRFRFVSAIVILFVNVLHVWASYCLASCSRYACKIFD
jgi:hypothetical protein